MTSIYKLFADFIKQPYDEITETSWQHKIILFGRVGFFFIGVGVILSVILAWPVAILVDRLGVEIINRAEPQYLLDKLGIKKAFLLVGLIVPIVEECIFRLWLSFKKRDMLFAIAVILGMIIYNFFDSGYLILSFIILFGALGFYLVTRLKQEIFSKVKDLYGKYILLFSIVLFAGVHITNFDNLEINLLPIYLLLLMPFFLMSFVITFMRVRIGFIFAVLFHILINTTAILFVM